MTYLKKIIACFDSIFLHSIVGIKKIDFIFFVRVNDHMSGLMSHPMANVPISIALCWLLWVKFYPAS